MKLLLMRHGQAESVAATDHDRALTDAGRAEVVRTAGKVKDEVPGVARVVASPYLRAQQTAQLMIGALGYDDARTCDEITPDRSPQEAAAALTLLLKDCELALAVMHQPIISRLILYLTGADQPMGTSDLAVLEVRMMEQGCCDLICVL